MASALGSRSLMVLHVLFGACRHGDTPCQRLVESCIALNDQEGEEEEEEKGGDRSRVDKGGLDERFSLLSAKLCP